MQCVYVWDSDIRQIWIKYFSYNSYFSIDLTIPDACTTYILGLKCGGSASLVFRYEKTPKEISILHANSVLKFKWKLYHSNHNMPCKLIIMINSHNVDIVYQYVAKVKFVKYDIDI